MPVPTHVHSEYSALDGVATLEEIAKRCVDIGCPCCGLSDHHTVAGHLQQARVFAKYDIKPIFACEIYHGVKPVGYSQWKGRERDQHHLIVGALDNRGLANLWSLMDESASNFRNVSRATTDMLRKYSEGTYATSACALGLVAKGLVNGDYTWANTYLDIWGDNFYIALSTYPGNKAFNDDGEEPLNQQIINEAAWQFAQERGVRVIYEDDAHFANPEQYELHDAYLAMSFGDTIYHEIENRKMWHPKALFIHDEDQIREALDYLPDEAVDQAIAESEALGERVTAELPEVRAHLPVFIPKECPWVTDKQRELSAAELFVELVEEGVYHRYGDDPSDDVWDRVERECKVYLDPNSPVRLFDYMLMGWDLVSGFCKNNDIETGPGRGSSAGSIVAYCLGITDVDPLHYDLIFERFWNAGRAEGFPDIDMDFPRARRRDILHYLEERWGSNRVRPIGTITRMKPKAVCDKTWKACGVRGNELNELKAILDDVPDIEIHGVNQIGWAKETEPGKNIYVMDHVGDQIVDWIESAPAERQEILANWVWFCQQLCSRVSNYGIHPSGIIVADCDLPSEMPCRWNKDEELRITMFPMDEVDARLFVKLDVLGLRTLDTLTEWKRIMKEKGVDIEWSGLEYNEFPEEMWQLIDRKKTVGLFQIEDKPAVRKLASEFKPRSVEDLSIIVALNRPGPLRAAKGEESTADKFVKRKLGQQEIEYAHPFLEPTLKKTYGLFLYQEQVIDFFNRMNYTLNDSDAVRKILGKKKPEVMAQLKIGDGDWKGKGFLEIAPRYVNGQAEEIWDTLEGFASYSFNKSHSVAYGTNTFRTVFAKYFGTEEWYLSAIRTDEKRADKHIAEAISEGIPVLPPDIMESQAIVSEDSDGNIRYGFSNVKHVGIESGEFLCELRDKYGDLISTRAGLEEALATEKKSWDKRKAEAKKNLLSFSEKSPAQRLQSNKIDALQLVGAFDEYEDRMVTQDQRMDFEEEYLGVILSNEGLKVLERHKDKFDDLDTYEEMNAPYEEDRVFTVPGMITKIEPKTTRESGKKMGIVTIEYEGEEREFAVFPVQWTSHKWLFKPRTAGVFTIRHAINKKTGKTGYNFDKGTRLT